MNNLAELYYQMHAYNKLVFDNIGVAGYNTNWILTWSICFSHLNFSLSINLNFFRIAPVRVNVSASQVQFPEGGPINLYCSVTGSPTPRVTWYKNDEPIQTDERTQISGNF